MVRIFSRNIEHGQENKNCWDVPAVEAMVHMLTVIDLLDPEVLSVTTAQVHLAWTYDDGRGTTTLRYSGDSRAMAPLCRAAHSFREEAAAFLGHPGPTLALNAFFFHERIAERIVRYCPGNPADYVLRGTGLADLVAVASAAYDDGVPFEDAEAALGLVPVAA